MTRRAKTIREDPRDYYARLILRLFDPHQGAYDGEEDRYGRRALICFFLDEFLEKCQEAEIGCSMAGEVLRLESELDAAVAAERESCAILVEEAFGILHGPRQDIAAAIRRRGEL